MTRCLLRPLWPSNVVPNCFIITVKTGIMCRTIVVWDMAATLDGRKLTLTCHRCCRNFGGSNPGEKNSFQPPGARERLSCKKKYTKSGRAVGGMLKWLRYTWYLVLAVATIFRAQQYILKCRQVVCVGKFCSNSVASPDFFLFGHIQRSVVDFMLRWSRKVSLFLSAVLGTVLTRNDTHS